MTGRYRRIAALLAALGIALSLPAAQPSAAGTEAELKALNENIARVQRQVQQDAARKDSLSRDLREAERAVVRAQGELKRLRAERAGRAAIRKHLESEKTEREAEQARTEAELAKQLRAAYFMGRNEPLKLLLNQRDPAEFSRNLAYYGYLGRLRADQIRKINENIAEIDELTAKIEAEDAELARLELLQKERVTEREAARQKRGMVLASLEREARNRTASLQRMRRDKQDLEKLLERLRQATRALPYDPDAPFAQTRGRLNWPAAGQVTVNYGATISGLGKAEHVEIDTKDGANVTAIHEGRVIFADYIDGRGQLIIIDHGNDYWSLYGHLGQMYRELHDTVKGGDIIGTTGDTGGRRQPGLYFEIRRQQKPVDPRAWFRSAAPPTR